jgi:hypothetical protein
MSERNRSLFWKAVGLAGRAEVPRLVRCYLMAVKP